MDSAASWRLQKRCRHSRLNTTQAASFFNQGSQSTTKNAQLDQPLSAHVRRRGQGGRQLGQATSIFDHRSKSPVSTILAHGDTQSIVDVPRYQPEDVGHYSRASPWCSRSNNRKASQDPDGSRQSGQDWQSDLCSPGGCNGNRRHQQHVYNPLQAHARLAALAARLPISHRAKTFNTRTILEKRPWEVSWYRLLASSCSDIVTLSRPDDIY